MQRFAYILIGISTLAGLFIAFIVADQMMGELPDGRGQGSEDNISAEGTSEYKDPHGRGNFQKTEPIHFMLGKIKPGMLKEDLLATGYFEKCETLKGINNLNSQKCLCRLPDTELTVSADLIFDENDRLKRFSIMGDSSLTKKALARGIEGYWSNWRILADGGLVVYMIGNSKDIELASFNGFGDSAILSIFVYGNFAE